MEQDAGDLVQEMMCRAWGNFSLTEERSYRRAWLFVILRNVAGEWHRTQSRRVRLNPMTATELTELASDDLTEAFAPLGPMSEDRFAEFLNDELAGALEALSPAAREIVLLSAIGELTYREIAEVLDCPIGTVMSRMARARRTLREKLADCAGIIRGTTELRT